ncbi:MAG: glycosyltransferase [Actinomycetota bacterium]
MPALSLLLPVGNDAAADDLEFTFASLQAQTEPAWELVAVPTTGIAADVGTTLADLARLDPRVTVPDPAPGGGAVGTANRALERARGQWVAFIEPGDLLDRHAAARVSEAAGIDGTDFVYTDEDRIDAAWFHSDPWYKPDWSPERLRAQHYTGGLAAFRRPVVERLGGLRPEVEGAHHHDLALRMGEEATRVVHIPTVLYHRRRPPSEDTTAGGRAVADHLARTGVPAAAEPHDRPGLYRLRPRLRAEPLVSIVIPTGGTTQRVRGEEVALVDHCVDSIGERSTYQNFEIVCVVDAAGYDEIAGRLDGRAGGRVRLVRYDQPFDFPRKINVGVLESRGEFVILLNDDTEVITEDWIEHLLLYAQDERVGAVGARLLFGDGRIQHAGIIGTWGVAGHCYYGFPGDHAGHGANALVPGNFIAVTAACLMTRRTCFDEVGGMSLEYPLNYNDVDFCLKLHRAGYRNVCTPDARLWHLESASRRIKKVNDEEIERLRTRWGHILNHDPFYNPNLMPWSSDFTTPVYLGDGTPVPPPEPTGLYWLREALAGR